MNPFVRSSLLVLARVLLLKLGAQGLMDDETLNQVVDAITTLAVLGWGIHSAYKERQKLVTLGGAANMTEREAEQAIADPLVPTPSVTTPKHEVPK